MAVKLIAANAGAIVAQSSIIENEPWGFASENTFLNMVVEIETILSPFEILKETQKIEVLMGRKQKTKNSTYQDRLIDIDIILYDDVVLETPKLQIPHRLFHQRDFVLKPLCEIAPDYIHPILNKPIKNL